MPPSQPDGTALHSNPTDLTWSHGQEQQANHSCGPQPRQCRCVLVDHWQVWPHGCQRVPTPAASVDDLPELVGRGVLAGSDGSRDR